MTEVFPKKGRLSFATFRKIAYLCLRMIDSKTCIQTLQSRKSTFEEQFKVHSMRLFGSVARNEQSESSDVDLFVDMEPNLLLQVGLKQYIEDLLRCRVDIIRNHKRIDPFLLQRINRDGIYVFN